MSNEEKKLGKPEFFELREKRLKLVYRILYAVVAIWIAVLSCIATQTMTLQTAPMYAFLLSASSLVIINIVKYAMMEFRCMKVSGKIDDKLIEQTEERYDYIWKSFSLILALDALPMLVNLAFPATLSIAIFTVAFAVCEVYYIVVTIVGFFKKSLSDTSTKFLDVIGLFIGTITAYSVCALLCLVAI